jgi:hypothetical protein
VKRKKNPTVENPALPKQIDDYPVKLALFSNCYLKNARHEYSSAVEEPLRPKQLGKYLRKEAQNGYDLLPEECPA